MYPPNPYDVLSLTGIVDPVLYCDICGVKIDQNNDYQTYSGGAICCDCAAEIEKSREDKP